MIYVLLYVSFGAGGFAAEFNSQDACEEARSALLAETKGDQTISMCVPKG